MEASDWLSDPRLVVLDESTLPQIGPALCRHIERRGCLLDETLVADQGQLSMVRLRVQVWVTAAFCQFLAATKFVRIELEPAERRGSIDLTYFLPADGTTRFLAGSQGLVLVTELPERSNRVVILRFSEL